MKSTPEDSLVTTHLQVRMRSYAHKRRTAWDYDNRHPPIHESVRLSGSGPPIKDYERLTDSSEAMIYLAMTRLMVRRLV